MTTEVRPILTVAVPVFQAGRHLRRSLEALEESITRASDDIEVIIVVNRSTDDSLAIADEFGQRNGWTVVANRDNLGFRYSIDLLAELAHGSYVWFVGAQESLFDGAIAQVCSDAREIGPLLILLNYAIYAEVERRDISTNAVGITEDRYYTSRTRFFVSFNGPPLAMSASVVRLDAFRNSMQTALHADNWAVLERLVLACVRDQEFSVLVNAEPTFRLYREVDGWWTTDAVLSNFIGYVDMMRVRLRRHLFLRALFLHRHCTTPLMTSLRLYVQNGYEFRRDTILATSRLFWTCPRYWVWSIPRILIAFNRQFR